MTPPLAPPPQPPAGTPFTFSLNRTELLVNTGGFTFWRAPVSGVTLQTLDNLGKRITLTRVAVAGPLGLFLRKKSGNVTVVVVASDGRIATVKVKPKHGEAIMAWAVAYNAWVDIVNASK